MTKSKKFVFACLFLIAVAIILWQLSSKEFFKKQLSNILGEKPVLASVPTSYLNNTRTQQFNKYGLLDYTLTADIIRQFDVDAITTPNLIIDQPFLTIYDDETESNGPLVIEKLKSNAASPMVVSTVSADIAEGFDNNDKLTLKGNVIVTQIDENGDPSQLRTSILYLEPSRRYAQTDKPVIITDTEGTTSATGMKIFFNEKRIELLSKVNSQYTPR